MSANTERIVLGSGSTYIQKFTESLGEIAELIKTMQTDENRLGYIQGGATLEYKPEFYTSEDDLGVVSRTAITKEEASLKTGIMTFCGDTLARLCATATVTEDTTNGLRIVKIGGPGNDDGKQYVILFVHEDPADGNVYVLIVGRNQSGFTLAFAKDKETVIDAEFKAGAMDDRGTKIIYAEDIPKQQEV